jgi:glutathione S-transferase
MATYNLHCNGGSGNSYKLALYLNCAGLDWEPIGVDFAGGQTRDPDWRAGTNTMGEVPVLEVNGQRPKFEGKWSTRDSALRSLGSPNQTTSAH